MGQIKSYTIRKRESWYNPLYLMPKNGYGGGEIGTFVFFSDGKEIARNENGWFSECKVPVFTLDVEKKNKENLNNAGAFYMTGKNSFNEPAMVLYIPAREVSRMRDTKNYNGSIAIYDLVGIEFMDADGNPVNVTIREYKGSKYTDAYNLRKELSQKSGVDMYRIETIAKAMIEMGINPEMLLEKKGWKK